MLPVGWSVLDLGVRISADSCSVSDTWVDIASKRPLTSTKSAEMAELVRYVSCCWDFWSDSSDSS